MENLIVLRSDDPLVLGLPFKPYRNCVERRVECYDPLPGEPLTKQIMTPWGEELTLKAGDYLVSEIDSPEDAWPVDSDIFDETYIITREGFCAKKALTYLVPLTEVTGGDPDQKVIVETLEGTITVRAGDFHLARGTKGEIWTMPNEKVGTVLELAEEEV